MCLTNPSCVCQSAVCNVHARKPVSWTANQCHPWPVPHTHVTSGLNFKPVSFAVWMESHVLNQKPMSWTANLYPEPQTQVLNSKPMSPVARTANLGLPWPEPILVYWTENPCRLYPEPYTRQPKTRTLNWKPMPSTVSPVSGSQNPRPEPKTRSLFPKPVSWTQNPCPKPKTRVMNERKPCHERKNLCLESEN